MKTANLNLSNALMFFITTASIGALLSSCSSMSNLPEQNNVKVSRDLPAKECQTLGKIEGRSNSKVPKQNEALEDLQQEAANKGANYVMVKEYSAMGTAVSGEAYRCP